MALLHRMSSAKNNNDDDPATPAEKAAITPEEQEQQEQQEDQSASTESIAPENPLKYVDWEKNQKSLTNTPTEPLAEIGSLVDNGWKPMAKPHGYPDRNRQMYYVNVPSGNEGRVYYTLGKNTDLA